ncbi:MAG: hypothetical protein Q9192_007808 [Flavoplaca navasiana]
MEDHSFVFVSGANGITVLTPKIGTTAQQVSSQSTGNDLSNLDIMCYVAAIPATTIYRVFSGGEAPFPDNSTTTALINAKDHAAFQQILKPRNSPVEFQAATAPRFSLAGSSISHSNNITQKNNPSQPALPSPTPPPLL